MPAKLVVSSNGKNQFVVQLESTAGKPLLSAGPFTDKRSVAGLRRTLNGLLSDRVDYEDRTAKVAVKASAAPPARRARVAASAKVAKTVEAPIAVAGPAKPSRRRRAAATS